MTATEKNQKAQDLANEGKELVDKAESLLQNVVVRNDRLTQEVKQTKAEIEKRIAREQA